MQIEATGTCKFYFFMFAAVKWEIPHQNDGTVWVAGAQYNRDVFVSLWDYFYFAKDFFQIFHTEK